MKTPKELTQEEFEALSPEEQREHLENLGVEYCDICDGVTSHPGWMMDCEPHCECDARCTHCGAEDEYHDQQWLEDAGRVQPRGPTKKKRKKKVINATTILCRVKKILKTYRPEFKVAKLKADYMKKYKVELKYTGALRKATSGPSYAGELENKFFVKRRRKK